MIITEIAAPIWDIGANIKNQGITFAVWCLIGGTALVSMFYFFFEKNKTYAIRTLVIGVVLIGLVGALPSLGVMSRDTTRDLVNTGGYR
ncbi:Uncharacterised protein [Mycobacteroides abscessus subsp. abscessus]|uniref:hypothetical protein n=1 Tax=Mycobacteroides abscessus TaxID=36809 RepID=UPI000925B3B0|nr:hypothetical protein [Mycobacteroides abscessus]SIJ21600.1 Uncharacterised protein [Mycobacteroides abscessus subsp. abscessus]SLH38917.1 Uncharacterised protein [Mycobacteroides abscessus subsp. abscessus]